MKKMRLDDYLSKFAELKALHKIVKHDFSIRELMHHNWNHILRDLARGVILGEKEGANVKIVLASILLHDIGRLYPAKGKDHHTLGAEVAPRHLANSGFTKEETEEIIHCILSHGPRGLKEPNTLEAKVIYDVNVLSCSCGNVGVARVFHYFIAEEKLTIKQMMEIGSGKKGPRKNFYTETGRKLGEKSFTKAAKFWRELKEELKEEEQNIKEIVPEYRED